MVIGPTEFVTVNTIANVPAVNVVPVSALKYSAIGDANTLHAYIEPIHKLIKQLAIKIIHLFFVKFIFPSKFIYNNSLSMLIISQSFPSVNINM